MQADEEKVQADVLSRTDGTLELSITQPRKVTRCFHLLIIFCLNIIQKTEVFCCRTVRIKFSSIRRLCSTIRVKIKQLFLVNKILFCGFLTMELSPRPKNSVQSATLPYYTYIEVIATILTATCTVWYYEEDCLSTYGT